MCENTIDVLKIYALQHVETFYLTLFVLTLKTKHEIHIEGTVSLFISPSFCLTKFRKGCCKNTKRNPVLEMENIIQIGVLYVLSVPMAMISRVMVWRTISFHT